MNFPELSTNRLLLTRIKSGDVDSLFELYSNPLVVKYYDLEPFVDIDQVTNLICLFESRFEMRTGIRWAIREKSTEQLIGTCGFNSWSDKMRNAIIGYDLKQTYWNNGYMTEALFEIVYAAFAGVLPCGKLHRIQADTIPGNIASEKVLLKLGFKQEGIRRESAYLRGRFHDLNCFGLLESEFKSL